MTFDVDAVNFLGNYLSKKRLHKGQGQVFPICSSVSHFSPIYIHEWILFLLTFSQPTSFEHLTFFALQGVFCFAQILLQYATGWGKSWGSGRIGNFLGWLGTVTCLLVTSPLFVRPVVECGKQNCFLLDLISELTEIFKGVLQYPQLPFSSFFIHFINLYI